jgi:hypothetical protein
MNYDKMRAKKIDGRSQVWGKAHIQMWKAEGLAVNLFGESLDAVESVQVSSSSNMEQVGPHTVTTQSSDMK